jgi:hypothetical protein
MFLTKGLLDNSSWTSTIPPDLQPGQYVCLDQLIYISCWSEGCLKGYLHQLIRNEMYLLSVPRNLKDKANTIPLFKYPKSPYNRPRHSFTLVARECCAR